MATLREWTGRVWPAVGGRRADGDLEEELRLHLELAAEALGKAGVRPIEAQRAAKLRVGTVAQSLEKPRDQRGLPWLEDLCRDLVFAIRTLARDRRFTLVVVLTLGLAIGASNTVFTSVNAILLRDLPFDEPGRIISLTTEDAAGRAIGVSRLDFDDWSAQAHWPIRVFGAVFTAVAGLALVLSAVGLHAVTGSGVSQRSEIGVRMALGATSRALVWLVIRRAIGQLAIALPIGVAGSLAAGRLLHAFFPKTQEKDLLTLGATAGVMVGVALAAAFGPAWRATRLDPVSASREA